MAVHFQRDAMRCLYHLLNLALASRFKLTPDPADFDELLMEHEP